MADRVGVLHHGRLEQVDTPERVYHRPATRFVAEFVGAATFVPGCVAEGTIVAEVGAFRYDGDLPEGSKVSLMIRPDDVTFTQNGERDAVIVAREFRGTETRYTVALASGLRVPSDQPSWTVTPVGARVGIDVRLQHVVVFPDAT